MGHVPGVEGLVLLFIGKEGRFAGIGGGGGVAVQGLGHLRQVELLVGVEGGAQGHIQQAVLGAGAVTPRASSKLLRSTELKVRGPPRYRMLPLMGRPWARPAMVWLTTAL